LVPPLIGSSRFASPAFLSILDTDFALPELISFSELSSSLHFPITWHALNPPFGLTPPEEPPAAFPFHADILFPSGPYSLRQKVSYDLPSPHNFKLSSTSPLLPYGTSSPQPTVGVPLRCLCYCVIWARFSTPPDCQRLHASRQRSRPALPSPSLT